MAKDKTEADNGKAKMKRKIYDKQLHKLQVELCRLQDWVKQKGLRVIIVFEGRDAAGKGGTIKARGCPAFLLNIEKRSLPRLMLSGDGLASKDAV